MFLKKVVRSCNFKNNNPILYLRFCFSLIIIIYLFIWPHLVLVVGFPGGASGKEPTCQRR